MTTPPRPCTTVLLIRDGADGLEVLMVVRNDASQYASAMVFPGGVVDPEDGDPAWLELSAGGEGLGDEERARRVAGLRELYEETGILLLDAPQSQPARSEREESFIQVVRRCGGRLDLAAMTPFAHWVTPEGAPKRFDTHFRLCWATTDMAAVSDGRETVSAEWLRPEEALALGALKQRNLLFPTKCQLELLAESQTVEAAVAAARTRRIVVVSPMMQRTVDGTLLSIPPESGYPVCEFLMPKPQPA